jgi:hypothetical protein
LRKAAGINEEIYGDTLATLEHARAQANLQFLVDMEQSEKRDATRFEQRENNQTKPSTRRSRKSRWSKNPHPQRRRVRHPRRP